MKIRIPALRVKNIQGPEGLLGAARRPQVALGEHSHTDAVVYFVPAIIHSIYAKPWESIREIGESLVRISPT